ncbi:ArsR family transcriptional regulator [Streptomyces sp. NBC_00444]|uniref:ArsR/SmtB family transcription factor n=1 Tax=Streptomyces sp. NBC_00444 TaxID=2975744 RepID=UPI002E2147B7
MLKAAGEAEVLTHFGRALADPERCRLVLALRCAPADAADLTDRTGLDGSVLAGHLSALREQGLVVAVSEGSRLRYELSDTRLGHALGDLLKAACRPSDSHTASDADHTGDL